MNRRKRFRKFRFGESGSETENHVFRVGILGSGMFSNGIDRDNALAGVPLRVLDVNGRLFPIGFRREPGRIDGEPDRMLGGTLISVFE